MPTPRRPHFRNRRRASRSRFSPLGIVYGDIGTSPLYVYQAIGKINGGHFEAESALGSLSLIVWTLLIVVALKYAVGVMRADNRGEGGILALMSLSRVSLRGRKRYLIAFGLIGAALLYGDGMITPAISVLSPVEGLKNASGDFAPYTMPIAAIVLFALFLMQRFGTAAAGSAFGPARLVCLHCRPRRYRHRQGAMSWWRSIRIMRRFSCCITQRRASPFSVPCSFA